MALDSRLALGAQGVDGLAMFDNSQKVAGVLDQNKTQNEFRRLYEMSKGDLGQMATNAQGSKLFAMVMPQIQAQQAAINKAALDGQKTQAEIGKFNAGATKDYADAGKTMQAVTVDKQRQQASALAAAMQGNPQAADFSLRLAEQNGQIDAATAAQARKFIVENVNNPQAISSMVKSLAIQAAEKPSEYITPDANNTNTNATSLTNNVLDNTTSRSNNSADNANRITTTGMNNQTQIKTTGMNNDTQVKTTGMNNQTSLATNAASNAVDLQRLHMEQNKGELVTGADGNAYIFYPSLGKYERYLGADGQPVAGEAGKVASLATNPLKENQRIQKLNTTLGEIEKLLPGATNSYLGAGVDQAARLFGKATDGAVVSSQLNALAGQVTSMMPRMEGPQSNYDVQLYREMAGDLGNPTIPVEQRMAALKTIRDLNQKYGQNLQQGASQAAPTVNTSDKPNAMSFFK